MHLKIKQLKKNIFHILILSYFVEVGGQMFTKHKKDYLWKFDFKKGYNK